jgi:hypothetical protein
MADLPRKISELTELAAPAADDFLPIVDASETTPAGKNKRISPGNLVGKAPFVQSGTGAAARTVDSKLKDVLSVKDFGAATTTSVVNQAAATAAAAGRALRFPAVETYNFTYTQPPYGSAWDFEGIDISPRLFGIATDVIKAGRASLTVFGGQQSTFRRSAFYNRTVAQGSGVNGPARGNYGHIIDLYKEKYGTGTATCGEIDGLYIVTRNDRNLSDPNSYSDSAAVLIDADQMEGTGYSVLLEGNSKTISRSTFAINKSINVQLAPLNEVPGKIYSYGIVLSAKSGLHKAGVLVQAESGTGSEFECGVLVKAEPTAEYQDLFQGTIDTASITWRLDSDGTVEFLQSNVTANTIRFRPNGKIAVGGNGSDVHSFYSHWQLGGGAGPSSFFAAGAVNASATANASYYLSQANALAGVNISNLAHFRALWGNISDSAAIGSYSGLDINSTTLANVYAVRSNINSGSDRWNLFMSGTAPNYLRGNLSIGSSGAAQSGADAVLGIANGVEPTGASPNAIQLYSYDESPGNTLLGLRTQGNAVVTEPLTADRSLRVRINGTTYKLLLKSI